MRVSGCREGRIVILVVMLRLDFLLPRWIAGAREHAREDASLSRLAPKLLGASAPRTDE